MKSRLFTLLIALTCLAGLSQAMDFTGVEPAAGGKSANITWHTPLNCSAQVLYGKTTAYGKTLTTGKVSQEHAATLSGLDSGTTYHFSLRCKLNATRTEASGDYTFTTAEQLADLSVPSLSVNPQAPQSDKTVSVKATVKNLGSGKATNARLDIYCADGSKQEKTIPTVAAAGASSATFSCPPPQNPGNYTIRAIIDPGNAINEPNEGNNEAETQVAYSAAAKPDLAVSEADVTHELVSSAGKTSIKLTVYIRNIGSAKASAVKVRVEGAGGQYDKTISSISPGSKGSATFSLPASGGTFKITADPASTIAESDESNNIASHEVSGQSILADLSVSAADVTHTPSSPKTGDLVSVNAKIRNLGQAAAQNVKVVFRLVDKAYVYRQESGKDETGESEILASGKLGGILTDKEKGVSVVGEKIGQTTIGSLAAGASKTATARLKMPQETDNVYVAAVVDEDNGVAEASEDNNVAVHGITVSVLYPDMAVNGSAIKFSPQAPKPGDKVKVTAAVRNNGLLAVDNVSVSFQASLDGGPYGSLATLTIKKLSAKASSNVQADWTVPAGVESANFTVTANPDRKTAEKDYSNNAGENGIGIALPDLEVSGGDISTTGTVAVGAQVTLKANISNIGTAKAQNADIRFYYVPPAGAEILIGSKAVTVNAGGKATATVTWTVPAGISQNPTIRVKANPEGAIYESDTGNNQGTLSLNANLPDIQVALTASKPKGIISSSANYHDTVAIRALVRNGGTAKAQNIPVRIMQEDTTVDEETITALNPGQNATVEYGFVIRSTTQPGSYDFTVVADPAGTITETLKDNNDADTTVTAANNLLPTAVIHQDKTNVAKRETVTFDCKGSTDPDAANPSNPGIYCSWDFGDGTDFSAAYETEGGKTVEYQFQSSGAYTVTLTATDSKGGTDTDTATVTVQGNQPPTADAGQAQTVYNGEESWFSPFASFDPDGSIASVTWNFGDGSAPETGGFESMPHTYTRTGTFTLTITVTDDSGASDSDTTTVTVVNPPPTIKKTHSEVYVPHTYHSPHMADAHATVYYGIYKVNYEVKYTTDGTLKSLQYTIHSGPAIVDEVSDADGESLYQELSAAAANGWTGLQVTGVEFGEPGGGGALWSANGGPMISGSRKDGTMSYSNLDLPIDLSKPHYFKITADVDFPAQMCAAEQYNCQQQVAFWQFT